MILDALKKRLYQKEEKHPGRWLKEIPTVVWDCALKLVTAPVCLHIFLVYGSEAILPVDIAFRAPRVEHYNEEQATAVRTEDVDRAKEEHLITCIRIVKYLEGL